MDNDHTVVTEEDSTCSAVGYQAVNISLPVMVTPFAHAGSTITKCCGRPVVKPGKNVGQGTQSGSCNFTISQNIVVAVPVAFGAEATVGETYVNCLSASAEEIDCDDLGTPQVEQV